MLSNVIIVACSLKFFTFPWTPPWNHPFCRCRRLLSSSAVLGIHCCRRSLLILSVSTLRHHQHAYSTATAPDLCDYDSNHPWEKLRCEELACNTLPFEPCSTDTACTAVSCTVCATCTATERAACAAVVSFAAQTVNGCVA